MSGKEIYMNDKIAIACDGAADLGDLFEQRGIYYEPLTVILGDRSGLDGKDITPSDIFTYFDSTKKTPKTAAVEPERYAELFDRLTADGGEVIYICAASTKSSCYANAVSAAKGRGGVYVIDSYYLSTGIGLLALYADDLRRTGRYTAKEIAERVEARRAAVDLSLYVDNMTFLHKGGRCSGVTAFVASVLRLHISLRMHGEGELDVAGKYIGSSVRAMEKYARGVAESAKTPDPKYVFLVHTDVAREELDRIKAIFLGQHPTANIIEREAGGVITSHTGHNAFALIFFGDGGAGAADAEMA